MTDSLREHYIAAVIEQLPRLIGRDLADMCARVERLLGLTGGSEAPAISGRTTVKPDGSADVVHSDGSTSYIPPRKEREPSPKPVSEKSVSEILNEVYSLDSPAASEPSVSFYDLANPTSMPEKILALLGDYAPAAVTSQFLQERIQSSYGTLHNSLNRLLNKHLIANPRRGVWQLAPDKAEAA